MPHDGPIRVIVEIPPTQLTALVSQVFQHLTTPQPATLHVVMDKAPNAPASASEDADEDIPAPAMSRTADPPRPAQTSPVPPVLPPEMAAKYGLGTLCKHRHDYQGTGFSLRYLS